MKHGTFKKLLAIVLAMTVILSMGFTAVSCISFSHFPVDPDHSPHPGQIMDFRIFDFLSV